MQGTPAAGLLRCALQCAAVPVIRRVIAPDWAHVSGRQELLPSAGAALGLVAGRPAFLDPEATRPVARAIHRGRPVRSFRL